MQSSSTPTDVENQRCWSNLPEDPLTMILRCLCFLDQLSFRGVCKQWRSASQNFPAQYGRSAADDPLWLMISRNSTATKWEFGDPSTSRIFTIDVPDLCRSSTRLVLSNHGWLLVFSSEPSPSLFFFNPFSRARIDLPWTTDFSGMTHMLKFRYRRTIIYDYIPVFALSAPPTSPDCVVYAITYIDEDKIRINFCRRGDSSWSTRRIEDKIPRTKFAPIKNAMVHAGILYWVEKQGEVRAYTQSEKGEKYRHFKRDNKPSSDGNVCSYVVDDWEEGKVSICVDCKRRRRQVITLLKNIEDPIEIEKLRSVDDKYRLNLKRDGYATPAPSWLRLDSFPVGSWCLSSSSSDDNGPKFCNWHRLKTNRCPSNCGLSGDSVWIEPKWIEPSLAIAWSS